jgi:uncharacterized protein YkwD
MKHIVGGLAVLIVAAGSAAGPAHGQTFEEQVVALVNQARWDNGGLPPLKHNPQLDASSEGHSLAMADRDFFAHCDLDLGTLPWDRMIAAGYSYTAAAENIAAGYSSPSAVMAGWMNSSGHRANILSSNLREIGAGYVHQSGDSGNIRADYNSDCTVDENNKGPYHHYWTQNFGRINGVYPVVIEREAPAIDRLTVNLYVYGAGWATEMRFRNESGSWSAWETYAAGKSWSLSPGDGAKTVACELTNGSSVKTASDDIVVAGAAATAVPDAGEAGASGVLTLYRAHPNPTTGAAAAAFALERAAEVRAAVFDITGREIRRLAGAAYPAGRHEIRWDGTDAVGRRSPPGLYFIRVAAGGHAGTSRVILTR